jgi:hypothetical protein
MLTYDTPALQQTGSRNLTGQRTLPTIWSLWPNIRFLPIIVAEKNATKNGHIQNVCSMCIKINKVGKQEVGIWWVQKHFPQYGVPIWSLWPNIRFLPSIVAEKNVTKNVHKNQLSQQTGSRNLTGPKTLPTIWYTYMTLVTKYQISAINSYWEKCDEKYLGRTEVKQYTPSPFGERGYNYLPWNISIINHKQIISPGYILRGLCLFHQELFKI